MDAGDSADFGYALMYFTAADWEILRAKKFREKWRYVPYPEEIKEALTKADREQLLEILRRQAGVPLLAHDWDTQDSAFSQVGLGIETQYGQWLQQALSEGDWLKTSAVASQLRTARKARADIDFPALVEPISASMLNAKRYRLLWAKRWRDPSQHTNIKEAMVALSSLKRTARVASLTQSLKLTLCDNLAVVLAFEKGRSGSPALNRLCRQAAAFQVGLGIQWRLRHIEGPRNVSDAPSRWFEPHRKQEHRWIQLPKQTRPPESFAAPPGSTVQNQTCSASQHFADSMPNTRLDVADRSYDAAESIDKGTLKIECSHDMEQSMLGACSSDNAFGLMKGPTKNTVKQHGMIEVFAGSGSLSDACKREGVDVLTSLDIRHGSHHDLTRKSTQNFLCRLILQANLFYCHFGTPCTVFSSARKGLKDMMKARYKERISCELAFLTAKLCELCVQVGTYWSIENPVTSALWDFFPIRHLHH